MFKQISEKDHIFLQRLTEVDFGPIAFKLTHPDEGWGLSLEQIIYNIEGYRQYLFLYQLYPELILVPSKDIDRVWHTHILDTAKYREDCDWLFGRFIDHWPYFGLADEADRVALEQAFVETQTLHNHHFQDLDVQGLASEINNLSIYTGAPV